MALRLIVVLSLAGLVLLTALIAGPSQPGHATFPGRNGKIVFEREDANGSDIFVMNADGSGQENITNSPGYDYGAQWSPDGTKIVFTSERNDDQGEIYVMNADGSAQTRLTNSPSQDFVPTWSPDGMTIVWRRGGDIWRMNSDGTGAAALLAGPNARSDPDYSPDGQKIVFAYQSDGEDFDIWVMNADGTDPQQLTDDEPPAQSQWLPQGGLPNSDADPSWSPDGTKIAYRRLAGGTREIWVMNSDGSGKTNITNNADFDAQPDWSPDGQLIAFTSDRDGGDGDIYTMQPDGSGVVRLTAEGGFTPDWRAVNYTWGDNNCADGPNPVDGLLALRFDAGLEANTGICPEMGENVDVVAASIHPWGDVDCNGTVDPVDGLKLLRFDAGLSVQQEPGCPEIGEEVSLAS